MAIPRYATFSPMLKISFIHHTNDIYVKHKLYVQGVRTIRYQKRLPIRFYKFLQVLQVFTFRAACKVQVFFELLTIRAAYKVFSV